jgi:hypothetical protein
MNTSVTRLDACQSLLVSPSNSTVTTWADHGEPCRHAALTCSLRGSRNGLRGDQRSGAGGPGGLAADASSRVVSSEPDT